MSTITLPNIRVSSDLTIRLKLKDGGVAIDWSTLSNIKACIYSDAQRALAGRCAFSIDEEDNTLLVCTYAANKPQYLGVNRIVISAKYMGETKTYDKPAFTFVRWTADQEGEEITIDDPDVDVEIEVEDVSSSILEQAIAAALQAAADAEHAAHLIPNQVLLDCEQATAGANAAAEAANAAGITSVQVSVEDNEPGTPSADVSLANKVLSIIFHYLKGETGDAAGFGAITATVDDVVGDPSVTVTASGPDTAKVLAFAFHGLRGIQGVPGVANAKYKQVDTLPTASADTMDFIYLTPSGTSGVYDMSYTEQDGSTFTWRDLGTTAIQLSDYATKAEVSQLEAKVDNLTSANLTVTELTDYRIYNGAVESYTNQLLRYVQVSAGQKVKLKIVSSNPIATIRLGFFANVPATGVTCTDYQESSAKEFEYTAQSNGYYAYSIYNTSLTSDSFTVDGVIPNMQKEIESLAEDIESNTEEIESLAQTLGGKTALEMVSGYYGLGALSVNDTFVESVNSSSSYRCGKASCKAGEKFTMNLTAGSSAGSYIFVDSSSKVLAKLAGTTLSETVITAPENAVFLYWNDNSNEVSYRGVEAQFDAIKKMDNFGSFAGSFSLAQNAKKTLETNYVRKDSCLSANVGAFTSFRVGVGDGEYMGYWLEVDSTNVKLYKYSSGAELINTYAHGLTITDGCNLSVKAKNDTADITIVDLYGGLFSQTNVEWWGGGSAFLTNLGTASISGELAFFPGSIDCNIWLFGDSYASYNQNARWPYYLLAWGFDKWLCNNRPGAGSTLSVQCLNNILAKGKPQFIVWTLGMNDGEDTDSTTPDSDWLSAVQSVIETCEQRGITPILATVPSAINDDLSNLQYNEGKNYWVRNSGYRYIDFATAVGANPDGTWRTGLKAGDIHPSQAGAKVLASQVLVDFPEITHP